MNTSKLVASISEVMDLDMQENGNDKIHWHISLHHTPEKFKQVLRNVDQFFYFPANSLQDAVDAVIELENQGEKKGLSISTITDLNFKNYVQVYVVAYTRKLDPASGNWI